MPLRVRNGACVTQGHTDWGVVDDGDALEVVRGDVTQDGEGSENLCNEGAY